MRKLEKGTKLVVASHNPGKLREIADLVEPYGLEVVSAAELALSEPEETETTFAGNARLKAVTAAKAAGLPALSDDSGLEVEALGGQPGVYSARGAGPVVDFDLAMQRGADELNVAGMEGAGATRQFHLRTVPCVAGRGSASSVGSRPSRVAATRRPRLRYDPMFLPDGETLTFGEMDPADNMPSVTAPEPLPLRGSLPRRQVT